MRVTGAQAKTVLVLSFILAGQPVGSTGQDKHDEQLRRHRAMIAFLGAPRREGVPMFRRDDLLRVELILPEKVNCPQGEQAHAVVRITNVSKWVVVLLCDSSPLATIYLRLESMALMGSARNAPRNAWAMVYDLGDQLGTDTNGGSIYALEPNGTVEAKIDISPILRAPSANSDGFSVRAELRATPWGWNPPQIDRSIVDRGMRRWADRAIVTKQAHIHVLFANR